jgi:hypothetical protein
MDYYTKSQAILTALVQTLFPTYPNPESLVIEHVWRDRDYLGETKEGKVASWSGLSVNLRDIDDGFRAIFIDRVENQLDAAQRRDLFGDDFDAAVTGLDVFIVGFVTGFKREHAVHLKRLGYIPRLMKQGEHGCIIFSEMDFLRSEKTDIALKLIRLLMLQKQLNK